MLGLEDLIINLRLDIYVKDFRCSHKKIPNNDCHY